MKNVILPFVLAASLAAAQSPEPEIKRIRVPEGYCYTHILNDEPEQYSSKIYCTDKDGLLVTVSTVVYNPRLGTNIISTK